MNYLLSGVVAAVLCLSLFSAPSARGEGNGGVVVYKPGGGGGGGGGGGWPSHPGGGGPSGPGGGYNPQQNQKQLQEEQARRDKAAIAAAAAKKSSDEAAAKLAAANAAHAKLHEEWLTHQKTHSVNQWNVSEKFRRDYNAGMKAADDAYLTDRAEFSKTMSSKYADIMADHIREDRRTIASADAWFALDSALSKIPPSPLSDANKQKDRDNETRAKHKELKRLALERSRLHAQNIKTYEIMSINDEIKSNLSSPNIYDHMSWNTAHELKVMGDQATQMAGSATILASKGGSPGAISILNDYAKDTALAVRDFSKGVADGVYKGFYTTAEAIQIMVTNSPQILDHFSNGVLRAIDDPAFFAKSAKGTYDKFISGVKDAYANYKTVALYGSAYEKGVAVGELTSNVLMGMATGEAFVIGQVEEGVLAQSIVNKSFSEAIGDQLVTALESPGKTILAKDISGVGGIESAIKDLDANTGGSIKGWRAGHKITGMQSAEEANAAFVAKHPTWEAPYQPGTQVIHFTAKNGDHFVRVHFGEAKAAGEWLLRRDALNGLTPEQIQIKYSLPNVPTHISDVYVPAGTKMSRGRVGDILKKVSDIETASTPEGAVQYKLEEHISKGSFKNTQPIGEKL